MTSKRAVEIKERLRGGSIVYSAWLTFGSSAVAEVIAGYGFDVLLVDMEHTSIGLGNAGGGDRRGRALGSGDNRPGSRSRSELHQALSRHRHRWDHGAAVMDAEQARRLVAATKYPPFGMRGYGPRRTSDFFRDREYFATANDRTFVMLQIEHHEAAERAEEIAASPGLTSRLGPADLAVSCGHLDDPSHPSVTGAIDKVLAAAAARNLPVCMGRYEKAEDQPALVARGARFVIASDDLVVLRKGLKSHLAEARRLLEGGE